MVSIINNKDFNTSASIQIKNGCLLFIVGGAPPINRAKKAHRKAYKSINKYKSKEKINNNTVNTKKYYLNKDEDFTISNLFKYLNNNDNKDTY